MTEHLYRMVILIIIGSTPSPEKKCIIFQRQVRENKSPQLCQMGSEILCLSWNEYDSNFSVAFQDLRQEKEFFDVTLACKDGQLEAHKVILSSCSIFFKDILKRNPHVHPLLYMKDVKLGHLQARGLNRLG